MVAIEVEDATSTVGIAHRQLGRLRAEGALSGRLATGNGAEMRRALSDNHKAYERLRRQVRERAKKPVVAWRTDPTLLGGGPTDRELEGALEDHLVSFVLDDFLATTSASHEVAYERFDALTAEFVEERLRTRASAPGSHALGDAALPPGRVQPARCLALGAHRAEPGRT